MLSDIQQMKSGRCSDSPILILWTQWATLFLNILSVSHLKPTLRYVGAINGFQPSQKAVRAMKYLNQGLVSLLLKVQIVKELLHFYLLINLF